MFLRIATVVFLSFSHHVSVAGPLLPMEANDVPAPVADYKGSLTSSVAGAPDLALVVAAGTAFTSGKVVPDLPPQTVLTFNAGSGLSLSPVLKIDGGILSDAGIYTLALQARVSDTTTDNYSKLIDFKNGVIDQGVYDYLGDLKFYSYSSTPTTTMSTYGDIVVTRDSNGLVTGYFNGALQFSNDDSGFQWGKVDGTSDVLRFFLDDGIAGSLEQSAGAVARIRVWDSALSADQVLQLTDYIFFGDFEGK